jgi:lambda repressor-like predicted transcriptional regulator
MQYGRDRFELTPGNQWAPMLVTEKGRLMANSIVDLCREHGMNVEELSERSGLSHDRIMAIALGRWTPSPSERTNIADVFGVAPNTIAWGHKTPIQHLYGHGPG